MDSLWVSLKANQQANHKGNRGKPNVHHQFTDSPISQEWALDNNKISNKDQGFNNP